MSSMADNYRLTEEVVEKQLPFYCESCDSLLSNDQHRCAETEAPVVRPSTRVERLRRVDLFVPFSHWCHMCGKTVYYVPHAAEFNAHITPKVAELIRSAREKALHTKSVCLTHMCTPCGLPVNYDEHAKKVPNHQFTMRLLDLEETAALAALVAEHKRKQLQMDRGC
jgi:hypothetical protein